MIDSILSYIWLAFSSTLVQILILFGPGLLLTLILNFATAFIQNRAVNTLGQGWYLGLFGWIGTIIHELGHALFCILFWHKITDLQLFHPDSQTGTLGYVKHSYNRANIYQLAGNFFIGIGPILLGTAVIFLLSWWLLGLNSSDLVIALNSDSNELSSWIGIQELLPGLWNSSGHLLSEIFSWSHLSSWQFYVFIYLAFAIGTSLTLSPPDIKSARAGFLIIVVLIFILNLSTLWARDPISNFIVGTSGYYVWFYTLILLILLINIVVALLILLPLSLLKSKLS